MNCWICGTDDTRRWKPRTVNRPLVADDLRITDTRYGATLELSRCRRCGFVFAGTASLDSLPSHYEHLCDAAYIADQDARVFQMRWLLAEILRAQPDARSLVDVGAGGGLLVREARSLGLEADGVEPSRPLVSAAASVNGVRLHQGFFPHPDLTGRRFDVVSLIDVIEHLPDPVRMLRDCAAALTPNGLLVIVTPDVDSLAARLMGNRWWHYRPAHIGYFNNTSMQRAAVEVGCRVVGRTRAKWFFTVKYVAKRLTRYLPIRRLNQVAFRRRWLGVVCEQVVPINPRDSMLVFLRPETGSHT